MPQENIEGQLVTLKLGDGATPTEVFTMLCSLALSKSIEFSSKSNSYAVPDCTNLSLPAYVKNVVTELEMSISASGKLSVPDLAILNAWYASGAAKNCKLIFDAETDVTYTGAYVIEKMSIKATHKDLVDFDIDLKSHGAWIVS